MKLFATASMRALALLTVAASSPVHPIHVAHPPVAHVHHGAPPAIVVFTNVNVVPMDLEHVLTNQTVVIKAGHIDQIGPANRVHVPAGAVRIDGRGKYLLPGLADMHAHPFMGPHIGTTFSNAGVGEISVPWADSAEAEARMFLWLANGATTVRVVDYVGDPHGMMDEIGRLNRQFRTRAATNTEWIPHVYTAGQFAPRQYLRPIPSDPAPRVDSVAAYVTAYKALGFDHLKIHDEDPVVLDSVMVTAKRIGLPVVGHVPANVTIEHILPYYTSIEHPLTEYAFGKRTLEQDTTGIGAVAGAMAKYGVWNCPTQSHYDRTHYDWVEPRPPSYLTVLRDSGVKILLGTDEVPWTGVLTRELQALVSAGLTPYQALQTGTSNVAAYFGTSNESGTIAVGKRADLLLLTGNPLHDVRYTAQPAGVMLGGRWLPRAEIDKHVSALHLPMPNPDDTVQSYWANVMREAVASSLLVFRGITWTDVQRPQIQALHATYVLQRKALVDSLGHNDQYAASTARVTGLVAQQLRNDRAVMTSDQTAIFDPQFARWQQKYDAK